MAIGLKRLFVILSLLLLSSIILPAYAEVTSLKTNTSFYKGGSKIYFSGTTLNTDPPSSYITVIINDPNNQFLLLVSGISDSSHTFQIIVDTSTQENQHKFSLKGVYNATAFIVNKANGKTVNFVFSPDGSPFGPFAPTGLTATSRSSSEIDLSWSIPTINSGSPITGYKIERNDGSGFSAIQNTQTTTYQDTGLAPSKQYAYRVSAISSAGTSNPSNVVNATTLSAPVQTNPLGSVQTNPSNTGTPNQPQTNNSTQSIEEIIQQRIENAKRLQELLQAKSNEISLNESMSLGDVIGNTTLSQTPTLKNIVSSFDFSNLLYPLIALAGVGVIIAVLYGKKNRLWFTPSYKSINTHDSGDSMESVEKDSDSVEDDYSLMILKNRLAKGEITIEEFNRLKDALKEP